MPDNPDGTYTLPRDWQADAAAGLNIEANLMMEQDDDQASALTARVTRNGSGSMSGNLNMGGNKLTNAAGGSAATDYATIKQIQENAFTVGDADTGTANAYITTVSPAPASYEVGLRVTFYAKNANTGASTLQINGLQPPPALQFHQKELPSAFIQSGALVDCEYDGNAFQILNAPQILPSESGGTGTTVALGDAAFKNGGTAVGDLVQLEDVGGNAGLPAVNGSQLTGITSVLDRVVTGLTVSNTTAETTFYTYSVPANTIGTDNLLTLTSQCFLTNNTGSPESVTIRAKFGGLTFADWTVTSIASSGSSRPVRVQLIIAGAGSTNIQMCETRGILGGATGVAGDVEQVALYMGQFDSLGVDQTTNQTLELTVQLGTASVSYEYRRRNAFVKVE